MMRAVRMVLRALALVAAVFSMPATIYAFLFLPLVVQDLVVATHAHGYRPAIFEPEWSVWEEGAGDYVVGTVAGRRERASVRPFLPRPPTSENDLEDLTAGLGGIHVLYNSSLSAVTMEGSHPRVLPLVDDILPWSREKLARDFLMGYGPVLASTVLALGLGVLSRQKMGCWLGMTLFLLGVQFLFGIFLLALPLLP